MYCTLSIKLIGCVSIVLFGTYRVSESSSYSALVDYLPASLFMMIVFMFCVCETERDRQRERLTCHL